MDKGEGLICKHEDIGGGNGISKKTTRLGNERLIIQKSDQWISFRSHVHNTEG